MARSSASLSSRVVVESSAAAADAESSGVAAAADAESSVVAAAAESSGYGGRPRVLQQARRRLKYAGL